MEAQDVGLLLQPSDVKLNRMWFDEMTRLLGIRVLYRAPREDKHYDGHGELDSFYYEPVATYCIFEEHPNQRTMRKLGWNSELSDSVSLIHLPYDLFRLEKGGLLIVPSAIDHAKGRLFRINDMSTIAIYPASVSCEIAPVWESTYSPSSMEHDDNDFNLLRGEDGE